MRTSVKLHKLILGMGICVSMCAHAQGPLQSKPTPEQVAQFKNDVQRIVSTSGLWYRKSAAERNDEASRSLALIDRAERMFGRSPVGPYGDCMATAHDVRALVLGLNLYAQASDGTRSISNNTDLFNPVRVGIDLGKHFESCQSALGA